jgi:hypothetical protein
VTPITYKSGDEVRAGDCVTYLSESGEVEFVIAEKCGDAEMDWYIDRFPGGGVMLSLPSFGSLFLGRDDLDDHLDFVSRTT